MSTRSLLLIAAASALGLAACSSTYSDVYSFKKTSFKAPPPKTVEVKAPETKGPLEGQGVAPGIPGADSGIPGAAPVPGAAPSIPGLETPPPTPPAEPAPGTPPATPPAPAPAPAPAP